MGGRYFQTSVPSHSQCVYTRAREGTVSSFLILGKVSEGCAWNNNNEAAGREEPRDPRSPETLVVTLGTGECDRVPLGKASGAWSAGHRRDRTQFPVPKNVRVHSHPRTQELALRNTRHAADTHACSLQPCSHRCFTSGTARRKAQHSAHVSTCLHAALARKQCSHRCFTHSLTLHS